ncbi:MAG: 4-hydroxy-2-oxo-heptane,7-dioate aldolase [Caulobacteraceae bacterium]|jgi:4-hydroxy-2-oxoheptanedioate aldolase|nr:4-hydroxy-2-oxo-heptane,7-dioate aldolase [Caulobacteraceae bacterium]
MQAPGNPFKAKLKAGQPQLGLWVSLANAYAAEIVAGSGFDWLLLDTEHSPGGVDSVLAQLQAVAPYPVSPVVRPDTNDTVLIKRYLDIGVQTLLIPYVQSAEEARRAVAAMRYPPGGVRGVAGTTRATRFGRVEGYAEHGEQALCLLVQIETGEALARLEEIAGVEGVDGVFIGPNDLAASLGYMGQPGHPEVIAAIEDALVRLKAIGKPSGILTPDPVFAARCLELGSLFTAVGSDIGVLVRGTEALAARFKG